MSHRLASIDVFSHQGFKAVNSPNHYNEDRVFVGTNVFAVIDGATSVTDVTIDGLNTSAYTARYLAEFFAVHDHDDDRTAKELLVEANRSFRQHLTEKHPDVFNLGKLGPCAAVAVVKFHRDGLISHSNIADCSIVARDHHGWTLVSKHSSRHSELDKELADAIFKEIDSGKPVLEARQTPQVQTLRNRNRELVNVEYGVFNAEPEMCDFLSGEMLCSDDVSAFAMLSDGLLWPEAKNEVDASVIAAEKMYSQGVFGYYQSFKSLKDSDPHFQHFRRLKHMDDATGLVLRLQK